jgi:ABC-type proline/glycine betaine transport system permease subunit
METDPGRFFVEPWNALSSLLILAPAIYWLWQIRREAVQRKFMVFAIVLIALGGIGSALFHGFRASLFFLLMDVIPSAILTVSLSVYLWLKILKRWWHIFFIMIPAFGIRFLFWDGIPEHLAINLSYFITGAIIALPLIVILVREKFRSWAPVILAVASFGLALLFRQTDPVRIAFLPMGTHFLWHTFSAVGAYFILKYLYHFKHLPS